MLSSILKLSAQTVGVLVAETYGAAHLAAVSPDVHSKIFGAADKTPLAGFPTPTPWSSSSTSSARASPSSVSPSASAPRVRISRWISPPCTPPARTPSLSNSTASRRHQQALETFTSFVLTSLVGGVSYPVSVALFGLVYMKARIAWADGYATGDPKNRYSNKWAVFIWTTQMGCILAAAAVALQVAGVMGGALTAESAKTPRAADVGRSPRSDTRLRTGWWPRAYLASRPS